jgi:DNA-binding NarL/FixJ family response regulator
MGIARPARGPLPEPHLSNACRGQPRARGGRWDFRRVVVPERTVLVLGSNGLTWSSLRTAIDAMDGFTILDAEIDLAQIDGENARVQPDVVILGAETNSSTPETISAIRERFPAGRVVVLGMEPAPAGLSELVEQGVAAYLLWGDLDLVSLQRCLDAISTSDVVLASRQLIRDRPGAPLIEEAVCAERPPVTLTRRECDILRWLAAGLTQAQIAVTLNASLRTVKRDIASLHRKLDARTPFALGLKASALGLARESAR